ncbi:hypothetical protein BGW80DRAFT_1560511 [Lactifluus volemus]|nr:hypothetical protein BGW80DRAFT_1560511 [Lactifluus volemus]
MGAWAIGPMRVHNSTSGIIVHGGLYRRLMLVHGFCISEMSGSTFHVIVSFYVPVGIYSVIFLL